MSQTLRVSLIQMVSSDQPQANLKEAESLIAEASRQGARLVALPEYFYFMGASTGLLKTAESEDTGAIHRWLKELARRHSIHLLAGSLPVEIPGEKRIASSSVLFSPEGKASCRYDKMHLFDMAVPRSGELHRESDQFRPGPGPALAEVDGIRIGLSICYDLRFPELYRHYAEQGAEILTVPAAFTHATGKAHWHTLLRARAIENQCFVLAPNQAGSHPDGKRTFGHSLIIDPWGEILAEASETGSQVLTATLDLQKLRDLRRDFPVLAHRRIRK